MNRRLTLSKREALAQSKASLDFYAGLAGVEPHEFHTTMKPIVHRSKTPSLRPLERDVLKECLAACRDHPAVAFARRRQSGLFRALDSDRLIRVGTMGEPDIDGMLVSGRYFACEAKREGGQPSTDQQWRIDRINRHGGLAFVARCAEDVGVALNAL
jgi:hypothetical protein